MKCVVREATEEDARFIGARLREADRREVEALGFDPAGAVLWSFRASDVIRTGELDGEPAMIFGAGGGVFGEEVGAPPFIWALGTDRCFGSPKQLVRQGRRFVSEMVERYGYLENYCDARYAQALNWLRRIGFTVGEPVPYGPFGNLFCKLSIQGKE